MGETASTWKTPLHSSDTEHEWQKRYESKGKGGAFRLNRGERTFPLTPAALDTRNLQESNPFDADSD